MSSVHIFSLVLLSVLQLDAKFTHTYLCAIVFAICSGLWSWASVARKTVSRNAAVSFHVIYFPFNIPHVAFGQQALRAVILATYNQHAYAGDATLSTARHCPCHASVIVAAISK